MAPGKHTSSEAVEHELDPRLVKKLARYRGRWVAVSGSRVLADGDSPQDVYAKAREQGVDVPVVFRVREDDRRTYFY